MTLNGAVVASLLLCGASAGLGAACSPAFRAAEMAGPALVLSGGDLVVPPQASAIRGRPVGYVRLKVSWPEAPRRTLAIPGSTTRFQIKVTAADLPEPIFGVVDRPGAATASIRLSIPAGSGRTLQVEGFNAVGKVVARGSKGDIVIVAGQFTPVAVAVAASVGDVTGTVLNAETGGPEVGVLAQIGSASAFTDASGSFTIADADAGFQTLVLSKQSFVGVSLGISVGTGTASALATRSMQPLHWTAQSSPVASNLHAVVAVSAEEAYAGGEGGALLHTVDAGRTWVREPMVLRPCEGVACATPSATVSVAPDVYAFNVFRYPDGGGIPYVFANTSIGWLRHGLGTAPGVWEQLPNWDQMAGPGTAWDAKSAVAGGLTARFMGDGATVTPLGGVSGQLRSFALNVNGQGKGYIVAWGPAPTPLQYRDGFEDLFRLPSYSMPINHDPAAYHALLGWFEDTWAVGNVDNSGTPQAAIARCLRQSARCDIVYKAPTTADGSSFRAIAYLGSGQVAVGTRGEVAIQYPGAADFVKTRVAPCEGCAPPDLNDVSFADPGTGWAVGDKGVILKY